MLKINKFSMGLLAVFLSVGILSGCGTSKEETSNASPGASNAVSAAPSSDSGSPSAEAAASNEPKETVELTVSAAASLTDALKDIEADFEQQNPNIKLSFNFGGSGTLQQQIEQGAPADLFLSASAKNMQALVDKGLVDTTHEVNLLNNTLVVVTPPEQAAVQTLDDLAKAEVKTVGIGIPESVPAGNYAKEALTSAKLWDSLQSKTVQGKDVKQVLQYVETGNADAGFVYQTDALTTDKVKVAFTVDSSLYSPIQYPIGVVKATKHSSEAEAFYSYLQSEAALNVFKTYGFTIPGK
ncbi:molybdate ABC transporter substrate-binding protein [Paenibacillus pinistramenti]|uniref:molybdate ABC transporter substrate-binding protein n=1 Tax=Paenibacillus pinistramenti TaxID=1768003 RepID=UPI001109FEAA|nr:molybdate ABC transporter substrate-binding protein [Paenibacillus pinistramenti]